MIIVTPGQQLSRLDEQMSELIQQLADLRDDDFVNVDGTRSLLGYSAAC